MRLAHAVMIPGFLFSLVLTAAPALAYIPHGQTIVNRLVRNHGKGPYVVEQEVQFRTAAEPVVLREKWIIENGETMKLAVSAPKQAEGARFEAVYRDGKRVAPDLEGGVRTTALSPEFLEGFEHARSGKGFLTALVRAHVVPATILRDRPRATRLDQVKYQPEPHVRLGRTSGVVTWVFGEPTGADAKKLNPEAWIEQDAFLLRRIRFPSEAEVSSERYSNFANSLKLPRERTVTWGEHSALIRVLSVKPLAAAQVGKLLETSSVEKTAKTARLPDLPQVKEFYSRFR